MFNDLFQCRTNHYLHIDMLFFPQLNYDIPTSQLEFLRVGSRHATQTFTYHCRNSAASVIFRTQNNREITPTKVIYDGCQVSRNEFLILASSNALFNLPPFLSCLTVETIRARCCRVAGAN